MSTQMSNPANKLKWLLRREFWENKGSMFWAPVIIAAILVLLTGGTLGYGVGAHHIPTHFTINGHTMVNGGATDVAVSLETRTMIARMASGTYLGAATPLLAVLAGVVFFYCLSALYDERRDRSILFWKSLPVSDPLTVASKVITAVLVAPAIAIGVALLSSLATLLIVCFALTANGLHVLGPVLGSSELYLSPLRLVALLPVYVVWALPAVGWLMLVSSWARSKPFLWAVGVPVVALVLAKWLDVAMLNFTGQALGLGHMLGDITARILGGVVPGIWFTYDHVSTAALHSDFGIDLGRVVTQSYLTLAGPDAWIGVAAGIAMLYGAIRMRRWRDEG